MSRTWLCSIINMSLKSNKAFLSIMSCVNVLRPQILCKKLTNLSCFLILCPLFWRVRPQEGSFPHSALSVCRTEWDRGSTDQWWKKTSFNRGKSYFESLNSHYQTRIINHVCKTVKINQFKYLFRTLQLLRLRKCCEVESTDICSKM